MGVFRTSEAKDFSAYHAQVAAATATSKLPIFRAPQACKVLDIKVLPQAATTGDNTNTKNLNILNVGTADAGTTEVANLDLVTGVDLANDVAKNIPLNATYANGAPLAEGEVLALQYEKVGTGVNVGPLTVQIVWIPA